MLALSALTTLRLVALQFAGFDLDFEEAQYWVWSQTPAFGYFSKPPMIAWLISTSTEVCGDGEACIRSASPLFYAATSFIVFLIGRRLYDDVVGLWSALLFALAPGVAFSSRLMTTDVPLLFFWALALLLLLRLIDRPSVWRAVATGGVIGLGMLSKYAMAYFFLCAGLAAIWLPQVRRVLMARHGAVVVATSLAVFAPNLVWNLAHDFQTFEHTRALAIGDGLRLRPGAAIEFLVTQFVIAVPLVAIAFALRVGGWFAPVQTRWPDRLLICFSIPVFVAVTIIAGTRGAYANWAAPAIIGCTLLGTAVILRWRVTWLPAASLAFVLSIQALLLAADSLSASLSIPGPRGPIEPYQRVTGWPAAARQIEDEIRVTGARSVIVESRPLAALMSHYLRDSAAPVLFLPQAGEPPNYFAITTPATPTSPFPGLLLPACQAQDRFTGVFDRFDPLGVRTVPSGATSVRALPLFLVDGPRADPLLSKACP